MRGLARPEAPWFTWSNGTPSYNLTAWAVTIPGEDPPVVPLADAPVPQLPDPVEETATTAPMPAPPVPHLFTPPPVKVATVIPGTAPVTAVAPSATASTTKPSTRTPRERLPKDSVDVRAALNDPGQFCEGLGLLAGRRGRDWWREGRSYKVRCPEHGGCSLHVSLGKDGTIRGKCFGCDFTGDALSIVARVLGLSLRQDFREVLREAAALAGISLDTHRSEGWAPRPRPTPPPTPPEPPTLDDATFAELAEFILAACPLDAEQDVCAYLAGRGLLDIARYQLAALPGDPGKLRALHHSVVERFGHDAWMLSGLARREGAQAGEWAWSEHRLVLPWRNADGTVGTLQRRLVRAAREGDRGKYVFPGGRYHPPAPFGAADVVEEMGPDTSVVFVEGALDTLAMRALVRADGRDRAVLGLPGVEGWRAEWASYGVGRAVYIALDPDGAGERKVAAMETDLRAAGALRIARARPVGGKDWSDVWAARAGAQVA